MNIKSGIPVSRRGGGGYDLKKLFSITFNGKTYDFSSKISFNNE